MFTMLLFTRYWELQTRLRRIRVALDSPEVDVSAFILSKTTKYLTACGFRKPTPILQNELLPILIQYYKQSEVEKQE